MLNEAQYAVVNSVADKLLCLAGAGTGKTYTLIARIQRLIHDGVDPRSILVLTFTNAAAFEMEQRFMKDKLHPIYMPKFATFHSFCYGLLASDPEILNLIGYTQVPEVATDIQVKEINSLAAQQCNIKTSEKSDPEKYKTLRKAVKRILKQRNLITFNNMCYDVCQLFVNNLPPVWKYKDRYKYVMIDEFQDTDDKQYKFMMSFTRSNLFVVGDALQSLYSFRGADSSIIKSLASDPEWEVHKLTENYRSTEEICNFANSMSGYADETYRVTIQGHGHGDSVQVITPGWDWKNYLSDIIQPDKETAVLCRTNAEVAKVCDYLRENNIAFTTSRSPQEVINLCNSVLDDKYKLDWVASLLPAGMYEAYIRESTLDKEYTFDKFYENFKSVYSVKHAVETVNAIKKLFENPSIGICAELSELLQTDVPCIMPEDTVETYLHKVIDNLSVTEDNSPVYVGTVHSVKGLEFDRVIVLNVNSYSFKLNNEDNWNIYYVAITRAKTHLTIFKTEDKHE